MVYLLRTQTHRAVPSLLTRRRIEPLPHNHGWQFITDTAETRHSLSNQNDRSRHPDKISHSVYLLVRTFVHLSVDGEHYLHGYLGLAFRCGSFRQHAMPHHLPATRVVAVAIKQKGNLLNRLVQTAARILIETVQQSLHTARYRANRDSCSGGR